MPFGSTSAALAWFDRAGEMNSHPSLRVARFDQFRPQTPSIARTAGASQLLAATNKADLDGRFIRGKPASKWMDTAPPEHGSGRINYLAAGLFG